MALVLSRKVDESIMIGKDVEIIVIGVKKCKGSHLVRLAIKAPADVEILRREIWIERQEGIGVEFDPEESISDTEAEMEANMNAAKVSIKEEEDAE